MTIRISEDWADLPPSLSCLLKPEQDKAGLCVYAETGPLVWAKTICLVWRGWVGRVFEQVRIAEWPVEEFSVRVMRTEADRWLQEQRREVA